MVLTSDQLEKCIPTIYVSTQIGTDVSFDLVLDSDKST